MTAKSKSFTEPFFAYITETVYAEARKVLYDIFFRNTKYLSRKTENIYLAGGQDVVHT